MNYGVVDADNQLVHYTPVELPGPRLPHDMAYTENYAILDDCPMFWDPEGLKHGAYAVRFFQDMPTRIGVTPRRGGPGDVRWFEGEATYVLHWVNAYEDGDEIVLDGFFQEDPVPTDNGLDTPWKSAFRFLASDRMKARLHRWRLNLVTGLAKEEPLTGTISEFGMINGAVEGLRHRFARTLAAAGASVVLAARRTDRLDALSEELTQTGARAVAVRMDFRACGRSSRNDPPSSPAGEGPQRSSVDTRLS